MTPITQDPLISSRDIVPASSPRNATDSWDVQDERWSDAIDTLLDWRDTPQIDSDCLDSAIDYAVYARFRQKSAPTSMLATEDGEITFEWRSRKQILIVTILESGLVEYTLMQDCKVIEEGLFRFRRSLQTKDLEFEAA